MLRFNPSLLVYSPTVRNDCLEINRRRYNTYYDKIMISEPYTQTHLKTKPFFRRKVNMFIH
jgi:hypothetical protein